MYRKLSKECSSFPQPCTCEESSHDGDEQGGGEQSQLEAGLGPSVAALTSLHSQQALLTSDVRRISRGPRWEHQEQAGGRRGGDDFVVIIKMIFSLKQTQQYATTSGQAGIV